MCFCYALGKDKIDFACILSMWYVCVMTCVCTQSCPTHFETPGLNLPAPGFSVHGIWAEKTGGVCISFRMSSGPRDWCCRVSRHCVTWEANCPHCQVNEGSLGGLGPPEMLRCSLDWAVSPTDSLWEARSVCLKKTFPIASSEPATG